MSVKRKFPELAKLYERHYGLTKSNCENYYEAATVSLSRHHDSPIDVEIVQTTSASTNELEWDAPSTRTESAWANMDDATRDGAYSISIAAMELELTLFAVARAETRTGADYYVDIQAKASELESGVPLDLESSFRLEVAGVDHGNRKELESRLKRKINQLLKGESELPGFAVVVGFAEKCVLISFVPSA